MKAAILNAAMEAVRIVEGEDETDLLDKIPSGAQFTIIDEEPMRIEQEALAASAPLPVEPVVAEPQVRVALFNEEGACVNVLEGTLVALHPFVSKTAAFRALKSPQHDAYQLPQHVPPLSEFDNATQAE